MILYVNGDSHSAGAEAVNSFAFANDDPEYRYFGRIPHPDNLIASYGHQLANLLGYSLHCDAESASSNTRILRTTRTYLEHNTPDLIVIGWSSWEREEWLHEGIYWQINAGGVGFDWPDIIKQRYYQWIMEVNYTLKESEAHQDIHQLHLELKEKSIPHLFFNCFSAFTVVPQLDWANSYLDPYNTSSSYYHWLTAQGFESNAGFHFRQDAHTAWAEFLKKHLTNII